MLLKIPIHALSLHLHHMLSIQFKQCKLIFTKSTFSVHINTPIIRMSNKPLNKDNTC